MVSNQMETILQMSCLEPKDNNEPTNQCLLLLQDEQKLACQKPSSKEAFVLDFINNKTPFFHTWNSIQDTYTHTCIIEACGHRREGKERVRERYNAASHHSCDSSVKDEGRRRKPKRNPWCWRQKKSCSPDTPTATQRKRTTPAQTACRHYHPRPPSSPIQPNMLHAASSSSVSYHQVIGELRLSLLVHSHKTNRLSGSRQRAIKIYQSLPA